MAFFPEGRVNRYLAAVEVTSPTQPTSGSAWEWTDASFNGTIFGPAVGPTLTSTGRKYVAATTSGLAATPADVYLYEIDATSGTQLAKIKLNLAVATPVVSAGSKTYGVRGSPVAVDSDADGQIDRYYVADSGGRLYKVNSQTQAVCLIAKVADPVYAPLSVDVQGGAVNLYFGGGDSPERLDVAGPYHFYAYADNDAGAACNAATLLYSTTLPAGAKVWTTPVVSAGDVFFVTATTDTNDPCTNAAASSPQLYGFTTTGSAGVAVALFAPIAIGTGTTASGGLASFDGHLFVNLANGTTAQYGSPTWDNAIGGPLTSQTAFPTTIWFEP
jgi:Tfp pilus tip-associated adhesin PilY1